MSETLPCLVCGEPAERRGKHGPQPIVCGKCSDAGWRAKTCPSCRERPLHHRDYCASAGQAGKCSACRAEDRRKTGIGAAQ